MTAPKSTDLRDRLTTFREGVMQRSLRQIRASGSVSFVAAPAMVNRYVGALAETFKALGQQFTGAELNVLHENLLDALEEAFAVTAYARVIVRYEPSPPPTGGLRWAIQIVTRTSEDDYGNWLRERGASPFGEQPDALVTILANGLPEGGRCLDIGAGAGRNARALALRGFSVDAVEPTPEFAASLETAREAENLDITTLQARILDAELELKRAPYVLAIASQVVPHLRDARELRRLFELMARSLEENGVLALSAFVPEPGYVPDSMALQYAQARCSTIFPRADIAAAMDGLPFVLELDQDAVEFEQQHLPAEAWPPTPWFVGWASGRDVFELEKPPIGLRWLVFRRTAD